MGLQWLVFDKAGIQTMSHLSILPTALTDLDRLASVLTAEGYHVERNGVFTAFPGEQSDFDLMATHSRGHHFAWRRSATSNHLELIADVERQGPEGTRAWVQVQDSVASAPHRSG